MEFPKLEDALKHFGITEKDGEEISVFNNTQIGHIGAAIAFDLSKGRGRVIIDYDPTYPVAVVRIIKGA